MSDLAGRTASRFALSLLCAVAILAAACSRLAEPPQDARLVAGIERLATDTEALFAAFPALEPARRQTRYDDLDAQAAGLMQRARQRAEAMVTDAPEGEYGIATAGFLADYTRNLHSLAAADAAAGPYGLLPSLVALRREAMRDALNDALIYERDVLSRTR